MIWWWRGPWWPAPTALCLVVFFIFMPNSKMCMSAKYVCLLVCVCVCVCVWRPAQRQRAASRLRDSDGAAASPCRRRAASAASEGSGPTPLWASYNVIVSYKRRTFFFVIVIFVAAAVSRAGFTVWGTDGSLSQTMSSYAETRLHRVEVLRHTAAPQRRSEWTPPPGPRGPPARWQGWEPGRRFIQTNEVTMDIILNRSQVSSSWETWRWGNL